MDVTRRLDLPWGLRYPGDVPLAVFELALVKPTTKQLVPEPQPVGVDDV
jgi:hypothetical protein